MEAMCSRNVVREEKGISTRSQQNQGEKAEYGERVLEVLGKNFGFSSNGNENH